MVTGPVSSDIFGGRFLSVRLKPSSDNFKYEQQSILWSRTYFVQYVSSFSGLALSIYATTKFIMSFFYDHQQNKSMLDQLYGDDSDLGQRVSTRDDTEYGTYWASKTFEKRVKSRIEIRNNYCFNLFFWI